MDNQNNLILSHLDLTSLNEHDDEASIIKLCNLAFQCPVPIAAICVFPKFIPLIRNQLKGETIKIATVCNFPEGNSELTTVLKEINNAIALGADEIDMVMPYSTYLKGQKGLVKEFIHQCKMACANSILLKVILETGALQIPEIIAEASQDAITAGADFIKTSTGKYKINATPEAATIMLNEIKKTNHVVGFKAAGGIRTIAQASSYINLAKEIMGEGWISPDTFRIGASSLIYELLPEQSSQMNSSY